MVAQATLSELIPSSRVRLPPIISHRYTAAGQESPINRSRKSTSKATRQTRRLYTRNTNQRPPLITQQAMDDESPTTDSDQFTGVQHNRTLFICGFVPKRWHNSALQAVIHDLIPHFYVACNGDSWEDGNQCRNLLTHADALIFFVNEFTLGDSNCLLTLQYAWHLMVPIIMLRPPRTKLVICKREDRRDDILVGNGSILRSPTTRWTLMDSSLFTNVDYALLQDILYEGYKLSVVYDRLEHRKSMKKITERLERVLKPTKLGSRSPITPFSNVSPAPGFYLSASNESSNSLTVSNLQPPNLGIGTNGSKNTKENIRASQSLNNLTGMVPSKPAPIPFPEIHKKKRENRIQAADKLRMPSLSIDGEVVTAADVDRVTERSNTTNESSHRSQKDHAHSANVSRMSSIERRMSMSSLDDLSNYQQTQYLVFPMRDANKKPTLIRFPEDLQEERFHDNNSVWGSDTSLEEEAELAPRINNGVSIDMEDTSPIGSPAPYLDHI